MAGPQRGRNAGITGIIDLTGHGGATAQFIGTFYVYKTKLQGDTKRRRGRGSTSFDTFRYLATGGSLLFVGKISQQNYPAPGTFKGAVGTATLTVNAGRSVAYPMMVNAIDWDFNEKSEDSPNYTISGLPTAAPTYTGWTGTQQTESTASKADQEQYGGTTKTKDTGNLDSSATRLTDVWGTLGDTDSAEYTKLAAVIAAAQAPFSGMKLNTATFARDAIDGGTVTEQWALTTSDERVINESTVLVTDPNKISTHGTVADINNATPTLHIVAGQTIVRRTTSKKELNDSSILYVSEEGQRTTKEDLTMPGRSAKVDVSDLVSIGQWVDVYDTGGGAPASTAASSFASTYAMQIVDSQINELNQDESQKVYTLGKDTSKQKWEQERTQETQDPATFDIESSAIYAFVDDNSVPGASNVNLIAVAQKTEYVTHDHTGYSNVYDLLDSNQKITFPGTHENLDPVGLTSDGISTQLFTFGGSAPAAPDYLTDGLQAVSREITRINRKVSKAVDYFKVNKSDEQWVYDHVRKTTDPSSIKNLTILGAVFVRGSEPSAPGASGLVLNHKEYFELSSPNTSNKQGVLWFYSETTSADDEIFPRTKLDTDPYDLTSEAVTGEIVTTDTALGSPIPPTVPANMVLTHWTDSPLTDASASNKSIRLYFWGLRTSKDAIEMDGTRAKIDNVGIDSDGQDTAVYTTSGGVPADASPPDASLKAIAHEDQELNQIKSKHVTYFDVNDAEEKWLYARTRIVADASAIKNLTIKGAVYDRGGGVPSAPGASGLVLNHTETFDITSPDTSDLQGILWFYGETTSADDVIFDHARSVTDPDGLESSAITGAIFTTGSPPGDPSAPASPTGLKLARKIDTPLTNASASNKSLRLYGWELTTSAEKIERDGSFVDEDPNALDSKAQETTVYDDGGTPPTGAVEITLPADVEIDDVIDQQLNDGKWKRVIKWVTNNSKNLWERLKKAVTTDVGHVAQEARIVKVLSTATVAADDTYNPDTTNLEFATAEVIPISATEFAHIYTFKPLSAKNSVINEGTFTASDPTSSLDGEAQQTQVTANATESTPSVSGRVAQRYIVRKIGRTLFRHRWDYDFRSKANQHIAGRTTTTIDASGLESEAFTAEIYAIAGSPAGAGSAPATGLQNINYRDIEIENPAYRLRVYGWALVTNQQKIEYRESSAIASSLDVGKTEATSLITTTYAGTLSAYADARRASLQSDATFVDTRAQRETPGIIRVTDVYDREDKKVIPQTGHFVTERVRGIPASGLVSNLPTPGAVIAGDPYGVVWVQYYFGTLTAKPTMIQRTRGGFILRRIYSVDDTASMGVHAYDEYLYYAIEGCANNATFQGRAIGEVVFVKALYRYTFNVGGGKRRIVIDYQFATDTGWKHFSEGYLPEGRTYPNVGYSITTSGWALSTSLEAGSVIVWPNLVSFAGFGVP